MVLFKNESRIYYAAIVIFLVGMCSRIFYHFAISSDAYLYFVTDDFYYYLLPAKNFILHGFSSFDGITHTNGYHPLWFLCIAALYGISGGNEAVLFGMIAIVSAVSSFITFHYLWKLRTAYSPTLLASVGAVVATIALSAYSFLAMEITLAIPIYAIILYRISQTDFQNLLPRKQQLGLGFLLSLLILSRLDTTIFIFLFLTLLPFFYRVSFKQLLTFYLYFCLGGFLVGLYLGINYYYFGTIFTVSSLSKFLKVNGSINWEVLRNLPFLHDSLFGLLFIPIGSLVLWLHRKTLLRSVVFSIALILLFPVVYYSIIIYKTDWFLFRWYLYPLPFVVFAVLALVSKYIRISFKIAPLLVFISVIALTIIYVRRDTTQWKAEPNSPYAHAKLLQPFVKNHPGIYAMGDRAGITAYLITEPVIQLEGLASDMTMYNFIKSESDLKIALAYYKVQYLIETNSIAKSEKRDSCYPIEEPHTGQAGDNSAKMRTVLCQEPVWQQTTTAGRGAGVTTYVFGLNW